MKLIMNIKNCFSNKITIYETSYFTIFLSIAVLIFMIVFFIINLFWGLADILFPMYITMFPIIVVGMKLVLKKHIQLNVDEEILYHPHYKEPSKLEMLELDWNDIKEIIIVEDKEYKSFNISVITSKNRISLVRVSGLFYSFSIKRFYRFFYKCNKKMTAKGKGVKLTHSVDTDKDYVYNKHLG